MNTTEILTQDKINQLMALISENKEELNMKEFVEFFNKQIFTRENPDGLFIADIKISSALMEKIFNEF